MVYEANVSFLTELFHKIIDISIPAIIHMYEKVQRKIDKW